MSNLFDGFGSLDNSLLASSLKNVFKISTFVLASKCLLLLSCSRQILLVEVFLLDDPRDFRVFQSSFDLVL